MRKFIKKAATAVCAFAFAAATIVGGFASSVKAADTIDTTVHITVKGQPAGTEQIAINIWGGAWVDASEWPNLKEATTALATWGWGNTWAGKIDMTKDANDMYTCTVTYDDAQYSATDNHGIQVFIYGADNAAVAASYGDDFHKLAGDTTVTDIYVTVDYTNANGADGGVITFSKEAPSTDDVNTDSGNQDDVNTDNGNQDNGNQDDVNTDNGNQDNGSQDDVNTDNGNQDAAAGDAMILVLAVAAVAAVVTVVVSGRKMVRE